MVVQPAPPVASLRNEDRSAVAGCERCDSLGSGGGLRVGGRGDRDLPELGAAWSTLDGSSEIAGSVSQWLEPERSIKLRRPRPRARGASTSRDGRLCSRWRGFRFPLWARGPVVGQGELLGLEGVAGVGDQPPDVAADPGHHLGGDAGEHL